MKDIDWDDVLDSLTSENVNYVDDANRTPLHLFIQRSGATATADALGLLLAKGADIKARDIVGRTVLHYFDDGGVALFNKLVENLTPEQKTEFYLIKDVEGVAGFMKLLNSVKASDIVNDLNVEQRTSLLSFRVNNKNDYNVNLIFEMIDQSYAFENDETYNLANEVEAIFNGISIKDKFNILSIKTNITFETFLNIILDDLYMGEGVTYLQVFNKYFEGLSSSQILKLKKEQDINGRTALYNGYYNDDEIISAFFDGLSSEEKKDIKSMKDKYGLTAYQYLLANGTDLPLLKPEA